MARGRYHHLLVADTAQTEGYTFPRRGGGPRLKLPPRTRASHGQKLLEELKRVAGELERLRERRDEVLGVATERGAYIEIESDAGFELALNSLDRRGDGVELANVRQHAGVMYATVFVPPGKLHVFEKLVNDYMSRDHPQWGKPQNQRLVESVAAIRGASLRSFWTDDRQLLPDDPDQVIWWEVWLRSSAGEPRLLSDFRDLARDLQLGVSGDVLVFPERTVTLVAATRHQMEQSVELLDCIAELRRAKESPGLFQDLRADEQREWAVELLERTVPADPDAPAVCLLDTGVNREHPLLEHSLDAGDMHTCEPDWGVADHEGHGTEMAGVALYGDLAALLGERSAVVLEHRLESVKLIPRARYHGVSPRLYGSLTQEAVARAELQRPDRSRVACITVTTEARERGRPSSWSAALDQFASGAEDDVRRLLVVSAGNVDEQEWKRYPDYNDVAQIEDPGQSWNALTVGAHTERVLLDQAKRPGWQPIARAGTLSPVSTTSHSWQQRWPNKPDIVLEGGNGAVAPTRGIAGIVDELAMLTTHAHPRDRMFETTWGTSAAAAQAARMAAVLSARYPRLWPEALRGLLVHSADWTPAMCDEAARMSPRDRHNYLLRRYGYGVPSLDRASWSAANALTLIAQDSLQPFRIEGSETKTKDLNLHALPWPRDELQKLGSVTVELRVTLSYFIEPDPSGKAAWHYKFRYQSHGLRFALIKPDESEAEFRARVTKDAQEEEFAIPNPGEPGWEIGKAVRDRGSLHSDRCVDMTAAEIASRNTLAVYPVGGWWRERKHLERYSSRARYALIVSITTPETEIDIYTPVAVRVGVPVLT